MKNVPNSNEEIIKNWVKYLSCFPFLPSVILSQFLWFNSNIKINNKSIFISGFVSKNISFVGQIFHDNDKTKSWDCIKSKHNLEISLKYQLTDALWKIVF